MLIHTIIPQTKTNGPGTRFGIWVQGCSRRCRGCFNPDTWETYGRGMVMSVESICAFMDRTAVDGISISGGEPFEQCSELKTLLKEAHRRGLNTLVYTGYTYKELATKKEAQEVLRETDILIDGSFDCSIPAKNRWTGSGNQQVLLLKNGEIERNITNENCEGHTVEILIDSAGIITKTGGERFDTDE